MRNREWNKALEKAKGNRTQAAIDLLQTSIDVHQEWLDYTLETNDTEHGTAQFHKDCIESYQEIIKVLRAQNKAVDYTYGGTHRHPLDMG